MRIPITHLTNFPKIRFHGRSRYTPQRCVAMSAMSTTNGIQPYPTFGKKRTRSVLSPQSGEASMKCKVCGMSDDGNPAHSSDYSGDGKHSFSSTKKSVDFSSPIHGDDTEIFIGGAVKALGQGRIGGYAILYSTDKDPDVTGDFFNKSTDFMFEGEEKAIRPVFYDHGLDPTLKTTKLSRGTAEIKDAGVWFETQLDLRNKYKSYIYEMAKAGELGWSTGSAQHLVQRVAVGKSNFMKSWPIVEVSLTPMPVEPRTQAVALKSYAADQPDEDKSPFFNLKAVVAEENEEARVHEFELSDDGPGTCDECGATYADGNHSPKKPLRPMKSMFDDELAKESPSVYKLRNALDKVFTKIEEAVKTQDITGVIVDKRAKVTEAVTEYAARLITLTLEQMQKFEDGDYNDGYNCSPGSGPQQFYLRSFADSPLQTFLSVDDSLVTEGLLDEHSAEVVTALDEYADLSSSFFDRVKSWEDRCQQKIEFRQNDSTKSGRTISAVTLSRLSDAYSTLGTALASGLESHGHIGSLIELAAPKKAIKAISEQDQLDVLASIAITEHELEMAGALTTNS